MYISLKWKAIALTSTLLLGLSVYFAYLGNHQLQSLSQSQRTESYLRHKNELAGLLNQSYIHLLQLSDLIVLMQSEDNNKKSHIENILNMHWEYIQINWGLEGAVLYNENRQQIASWGNAQMASEEKDLLVTSVNATPTTSVNCQQQCIQYVTVPILDNHNQLHALQLGTSIADMLLAFQNITQADVGIITSSAPATATNGWLDNVIALTQRENNMPILQALAKQYTLNDLRKNNITMPFNDKTYIAGLIAIPTDYNNPQLSHNQNLAYFIVIEDISREENYISQAYQRHIKGGLTSIIISSLLITFMLWKPIIRLRQQAELLPQLSKGKFDTVREKLKKNHGNSWFPDEIDILDRTQIEVSGQLEDMQKRIEDHTKELKNLALFDSLTGLANRPNLLQNINQSLSVSNIQEKHFAILFLDLDNFKRVNDSLGHRAGDELLQVVAKRLHSCIRNSDIIARLGGDEFCIMLNNIRSTDDGNNVAANILSVLKNPIRLTNTEVIVSASIGIVYAPDDGTSAEELLQNADLAMYKAKAQGRNKFQPFDHQMNLNAVQQLSLETELRQAVIEQQFVLFYQPKVDLKTNKITSVEALVRWQHPQKGLLAPNHFVTILEETGLIVVLGEWIMLKACETLKSWIDTGMPAIKMAVNLSPRQFADPKLYSMIEQTISLSKLPANLLELEITESMVMGDIENNNRILKDLQKLGVSVAIDDFGTGYSSLSYLKSLPVDTLKIDRSFIMDIPEDEADMEITAAIIAVAHNLKLQVVAEGIETSEQQSFLLERGCDLGQGYLFSRPLPEDDLVELIKTSERIIKLSS